MEGISSGKLVEKKVIRRGPGWVFAIADKAERLALGIATRSFRNYVEIMDFEGKVLKKFKTKLATQIKITHDASIISILSVGGKIFSYNSDGEKLKNHEHSTFSATSEDGKLMLADGVVMDAEGNVLLGSVGKHIVIDATGKPQQKFFIRRYVGIAPNGNYVVANERCEESGSTVLESWSATYELNNIYISPQYTTSLLELKEEQRDQQWKCIPFSLEKSTEFYKIHFCVYNSFFACAGKNISYFGLDGNLKWEYSLSHRNKIKQFFVTPDAKHVFFTLKGRKKRKNIYILDAKSRNVVETTLQNRIESFQVTNDGRKLFVTTYSSTKFNPLELIAFDVI